jgi:hypothetical protein
MMRFFYIDIGYAVFGMESKDNVVVRVAPIAKWMKGKTLSEVRNWLLKKKAKVKEITPV